MVPDIFKIQIPFFVMVTYSSSYEANAKKVLLELDSRKGFPQIPSKCTPRVPRSPPLYGSPIPTCNKEATDLLIFLPMAQSIS